MPRLPGTDQETDIKTSAVAAAADLGVKSMGTFEEEHPNTSNDELKIDRSMT
jgi:hypothetical protein